MIPPEKFSSTANMSIDVENRLHLGLLCRITLIDVDQMSMQFPL